MHRHKFRVGQLVRLDAAFPEHRSTPGRTYETLRLLPPDGSECIKTIREASSHRHGARDRCAPIAFHRRQRHRSTSILTGGT